MSSNVISNIPNVETYAKALVVGGSILGLKAIEWGGSYILNTACEFCTYPGQQANTTVSLYPRECMGRLYSDRTVSIPILGTWNYVLPMATTVAPFVLRGIWNNREAIARKIPECIKKPLNMVGKGVANTAKSYSGYVAGGAIAGALVGMSPLTGAVMAAGAEAIYNFASYIAKNENPDQRIKELEIQLNKTKAELEVLRQALRESISSKAAVDANNYLATGRIIQQENVIARLGSQMGGSNQGQQIKELEKRLAEVTLQRDELIRIFQQAQQAQNHLNSGSGNNPVRRV